VTIKTRLSQAYTQTPWRKTTQKGVLFLILAILAATVLWIMLTVTIQASSAGLQIQDYERSQEEITRDIANLQTTYASLTSSSAMEARAEKLGFKSAEAKDLAYVVVPGYGGRHPDISAPPPNVVIEPVLIKPIYTQSLSEFLSQGFLKLNEKSGGLIP
jgi:hypothetical protein